MAFSIQTNVNALIAQENLRVNSDFQSRTIQRLTSGFRINQSGDDAAGLAIANKFRSDIAELSQGVRNANDGVAQLQIMDGGIGNISKMLDRLKTLATQSASSTFTGDRSVLNKEYQTLVNEIDRQAQSIGLATGGRFAQRMSVFIGGGSTNSGAVDAANGSVQLDLTQSVVDSRGLGLRNSGFEVSGKTGTDIGSGSTTSVSAILANSSNGSDKKADFVFTGPNFSAITVSVDLTGVADTAGVASKLNDAIAAAGNSQGSTASVNFRNAEITASVQTGSDGAQQLVFSSNDKAFQVTAGDKYASALLGNFKSGGTTGEGSEVAMTVTGASAVKAADPGGATAIYVRVIDNGTTYTTAALNFNGDASAAAKQSRLDTALGSLGNGYSASLDTNGNMVITGKGGQSLEVQVAGDKNNILGLGTWLGDFGTNDYNIASGATFAAGTAVVEFSIDGGEKVAVQLTNTSSAAAVVADINNAVAKNDTLKAAGITASSGAADAIRIQSLSTTAQNFRVNIASRSAVGFDMQLSGAADGVGAASLSNMQGVGSKDTRVEATGASTTGLGSSNDVFSFAGLRNYGDAQTISFSAKDSAGEVQSTSITLTEATAATLDAAVSAINTQLQTNSTLKNIVAVKDMNNAGTAEGIRFVSPLGSFSVKVGQATNFTNANPVGVYDGTGTAAVKQGMTVESSQSGAVDISTMAGAAEAVATIGAAIQKLGSAQAAIGKGQNQLSYAVNLANSQISNYSAAESRIRDADVASEAANLTKAQVLQQASIAAMAQANSAPQAVLSLLRG